MKKLFLLLLSCFCFVSIVIANPDDEDYTNWDQEDVVGVYVEISYAQAQKYGYDEVYGYGDDARYFEKVKIKSGLYEIEVYDKVDSKFWGIRFTEYFIKFKFNPFLFNYDEGILEWDGNDGVFYEEP